MISRDDIEDPTQDDYYPIDCDETYSAMQMFVIMFVCAVLVWIALIISGLKYGGVI